MAPTAIPQPLLHDISEGRCLPFIGAGFSKNARLPDGSQMSDWSQLAADLAEVSGCPPGLSPLAIAQDYEKKFGRVHLVEAVRRALHYDTTQPGEAHKEFVQLPFDTIYTTNFDMILEDAYGSAMRPCRSLVGELQLPFHAGRNASNIVKMHGDLLHEEHIIITESDYKDFLDNYPVVATHLSAMLITRTPLFIGYSLSDPDFNNIRKIVKDRLGKYEPMGYVIQFNVEEAAIEQSLNDHLHIISLDADIGYDNALAEFFCDVRKQIETRASMELRSSRPDVFEDIPADVVRQASHDKDSSSVIESTSRLAFVMMPFSRQFDQVYRQLVVPALEGTGVDAIRSDELKQAGVIHEQIRSAIRQSRFCIADISGNNSNVLYEIGYAQAMSKPTILIAEEGTQLPFDVASQRVLFYRPDISESIADLRSFATHIVSPNRLEEAERLFRNGHYNASVATAAVVLEHDLRERLVYFESKGLDRMGLGALISKLESKDAIDIDFVGQFKDALVIRNRAVHQLEQVDRSDARFVIDIVLKWFDSAEDE